MNLDEIFWGASLSDLKNGYVYLKETSEYMCLCCGDKYQDGFIYQVNEQLVEAKLAIKYHIQQSHQSMFHYLLNMDKKYTSLTDHQKQLMEMFYEGINDKEIAKKMEGSASTVRNQRFTLREKAKQAKIFLSLMELLEDNMNKESQLVPIHRTATTIDSRYDITESEKEDVLQKYFKKGKLVTLPSKQKRIIIILSYIITLFERNKVYHEKEVNDIIKDVFDDFVTIRRYLIEYGFLTRKADGSEYWVK